MSFQLRSKPTKPVRKMKQTRSLHVYDGTTLSEMINWLPDEIKPCDAMLEQRWGYDESNWYLVWNEEESVKDFNVRMKTYDTRSKAYQEWQKTNAAEILEETQRRKNDEDAKEAARLEKEQAKLEKRLAQLKKKLKK